ncbi:MAG: N-6 DNA methylase [Prolixibacteraceae bacterium]|jgi:adenine-specific DNA-methyltransferase|nr:N-6 DNA methylase [Prolixibacteraceae bacterium]MBT6763357.1 N-6 DNA methylase [Prolixibacteraceae bacterium]MBT6997023.1 N-6 DNA methylase [Prolixibacteraceae bacterium]MBT7396923.1 N-6 DNA methylase [Prolixibacteraceae bacterium]
MPKKGITYKLPSEFAEKVEIDYANLTTVKHKKESGQFFTSKVISDFMGNLAQPKSDIISILDPGCGTAILCCSLIEKLIGKSKIKEIKLKLIEIDSKVIVETKKVTDFLKEWLLKKGISLNVVIEQKDFILSNSGAFTKNTLFQDQLIEKYDYIISNPPYFKISKSDNRVQVAQELVYGQPNIYSLFMGLSAKLLKPDGELIFIVPRSFAAGNYFNAFRKSFFNDVSISDIHIFKSRNKMFKNDNVLQENIIIRATEITNSHIRVSVSECVKDLHESQISEYKTKELIDLNSVEKILYIPSNNKEAETINVFRRWKDSLNGYNIQISTGPVVAFRSKNYLISDYISNIKLAPLIWLHNVKEMEFVFPLNKGTKPSYIIDSEESHNVLLKNKNYVLIRRFSSKDDKNRLVCSPYFAKSTGTERIGIENHLNYVYRPNGDLSEEEIWGISALFNSSLFDTYFRTFNGNTQVGATELKQIKMPPLEKIILIGEKVKKSVQLQKAEIDNIINEVLFEKLYVKNRRSTSDFARVRIA